MKKIYTAPTCELLGTIKTEILATSDSIIVHMNNDLEDDFKYGGVDENGSKEADANLHVWDHFDKGL